MPKQADLPLKPIPDIIKNEMNIGMPKERWKYHPSNPRTRLQINLAKPESPHWLVGERIQSPSRHRLWEVSCRYCGFVATRTTSQLNTDALKCVCRSEGLPGRKPPVLTYQGETKTAQAWKRIFPEINLTSVRNYFSRRNQGIAPYTNYTDAQILFGKKGRPLEHVTDVLVAEAQVKEVYSELKDLGINLTAEFSKFADDWLSRKLKDRISKEFSTNAGNVSALVAGDAYPIQVTGGEPIGYYLAEVEALEVIEYLRMETFLDLEDKEARAGLFIPIDNRNPNGFTDLEIMALLSVANIGLL